MYSWLGFTQDKLNDVVLTSSYVATLLVCLARANKDSFVWDFATGSAGLLVAAMNEMLNDAKKSISSPDELVIKEVHIKAKQLLGIEVLSNIYMLAILNMIMMGDGSSNVLNKNSLTDFDGNYGFDGISEKFPADAFVLNPPYSADGNGSKCGCDWNQSTPVDTMPNLDDFKKTISDYLTWEISQIIKSGDGLGK